MTEMKIIARIRTELPEKFGVPRQSGLVPQLRGRVVFEPGYRNPDAVRGLEDFSHIWLIWQFSQAVREDWSPTVRPPRLGGNVRMGVFATRSPFRPNPIGLSCVKIDRVEQHPELGPVIHVLGADLRDGTPIYDIKPYIPFADCHPDATGGWIEDAPWQELDVEFPQALQDMVPPAKLPGLVEVLRQDPRRAGSKHEPNRIYHLAYAGLDISFTVDGTRLTITAITDARDQPAIRPHPSN